MPDDAEMFDGSMLDQLIEQSVTVKKSLNELVNKCWYTDELVVVHMHTPENQLLYQDAFLDGLGDSFEVVTVFSHVLLSCEEILRRIVHALRPDVAVDVSKEALLESLFGHVDELAEESAELLIQISDAHLLSLEVLSELAEIVEENATMVTPHIVLWSDQASEDAFSSCFEGTRFTVGSIVIPRFTPREMADYIKAVFRAHDEAIPFDKEMLQQVIRKSMGVADEIDRLLFLVLDLGQHEDEERGGLPVVHLVLGALAVAAMAVVVFMWREPEESGSAPGRIVVSVGDARPLAIDVPASQSARDNETQDQGAALISDAEAFLYEGRPAVELTLPVASTGLGSDEEADARLLAESLPADDEGPSPAPQPAEELAEVASIPQALSEVAVAGSEVSTAVDRDTEAAVAVTVAPDPVPVSAAAPRLVPQNAAPVQVDAVPAPAAGAYQEQLQKLLEHSDDQAFIQLFGSYDEQSAIGFIRDYSIDGRFYYFRTDLNGRDWYVVVFGGFVSERAAIEVRDGLSAKLSEGGPWIRGMANIRNSIKR